MGTAVNISAFVGFIGTYLFICLCAIKAQTIPEAGLVATDRTWNHEINLPTGDAFCGIWVNLTAWWRPDRAPELSGTYTIDLTFHHPNFKETKRDVMKIKIPSDKKETTKDILICFSHLITRSNPVDQSFFTICAESDNIQSKNPIDLQISAVMSLDMECYPTRTVLEYVHDMTYRDLFFSAVVIILLTFMILGFCYRTKLEAWWRNIFRDGQQAVEQASQQELGNINGPSDEDPSGCGSLGSGSATSSGAASGAGPDEVLIKSARDDRRSGRARKRRNK